MHGGDTGLTVGNITTGRHSKYLPSRLDALYQDAVNNPNLLEMSEHIALLETRINDVLSQACETPVPRWADMAEQFAAIETSVLSGDVEEVVPALERFHSLLDDGMRWDTTWDQVLQTMEQLRKVADTEIKRKKELNQMIPIERVIALMAAVGNAVKRNVTNPAEIDAVYREMALLHGSDRVPNKSTLRIGGNPEFIEVEVEAEEV